VPTNFNTKIDVGIQLNTAVGYRNFEPLSSTGQVQYKSNRAGLEFMSANPDVSRYAVGDDLPFDVGGTSYSAKALEVLQLYWNQGWCLPTT
jgi:hypothetical protein